MRACSLLRTKDLKWGQTRLLTGNMRKGGNKKTLGMQISYNGISHMNRLRSLSVWSYFDLTLIYSDLGPINQTHPLTI